MQSPLPCILPLVQRLPQPYRQALLLTEVEGMTPKDLARRLGLSFSGAKSRVQRARDKLRELLLDCCHFEFDRRGTIIDYAPHCERGRGVTRRGNVGLPGLRQSHCVD